MAVTPAAMDAPTLRLLGNLCLMAMMADSLRCDSVFDSNCVVRSSRRPVKDQRVVLDSSPGAELIAEAHRQEDAASVGRAGSRGHGGGKGGYSAAWTRPPWPCTNGTHRSG